jgi:hypothetical protein
MQFILESLLDRATEVLFVEFHQDVTLVGYVLDLFLATDVLFEKTLDGVKLTRILVLGQLNFAETAFSEVFDYQEIIKVELFLWLLSDDYFVVGGH